MSEIGEALSTEIAEIEGLMRTDRAEYNRRADRYLALIEARDAGAVVPGPNAQAREKAEIERVIRTDRTRYNRDEAMQARYRALLDAEDGAPPATQAEREPGEMVELVLPSAWMKAGKPPAEYPVFAAAVSATNDVLRDAGDGASVLEAGFVGLPQKAQAVVLAEIVRPHPVAAGPLDEAGMRAMLAFPGNARLAREWGHDAPRRFATARERLGRIVDRLDDGAAVRLLRWLDGLPEAAGSAVLRRLGA